MNEQEFLKKLHSLIRDFGHDDFVLLMSSAYKAAIVASPERHAASSKAVCKAKNILVDTSFIWGAAHKSSKKVVL